MSLVKKYEKGGGYTDVTPSKQDSFGNFLGTDLDKVKFKTKTNGFDRQVADDWVKLYNYATSHPTLKMEDVIKINPTTDQYTIDVEKISDPYLKTVDWEGSKDRLHKNLVGVWTPNKDDEGDAARKMLNTYMAAKLFQFKDTQQPAQTTTEASRRVSMNKALPNVEKYITEVAHGSEEAAAQHFADQDEQGAKKLAIKYGIENLSQYLDDYTKNKEFDKFDNVEGVTALKDKWSKIDTKKEITPEQWEDISNDFYRLKWDPKGFVSNAKTPQQIEAEKESAAREGRSKIFKSAGITNPAVHNLLENAGLTEVVPNWSPEGTESWFPEVLKKTGAFAVRNPITKDVRIFKGNEPFNYIVEEGPGKGYSWENKNTGFAFNKPTIANSATVPGSTTTAPVAIDPKVAIQAILSQENNPFSTLGSDKDYYNGDIQKLKLDLSEEFGLIQKGQMRKDKLKKIAESLRTALKANPQNKEALGLYDQLVEATKGYTLSFKSGGILKGQNGLSVDDYLKKYNIKPGATPVVSEEKKKLKDISGTIGGQTAFENTLDAISAAGTVASFVPGIGAWGAGTSAVMDLAKDWKDGTIDNPWQHVANAGFVGLSLVGLGGLKALFKSANIADKAIDLGKLGSKAAKLGHGEEAIKAIQTIGKEVGIEAKSLKDVDLILEKVTDPKIINTLNESVKTVASVADASLPLFGKVSIPGSMTAGRIVNSISKADLGKLKPVAQVASAAMMAPGVVSSIDNLKDVRDWESIKLEDVKNVLMVGSLAHNLRNEIKTIKAIKNQATRTGGTPDKTTFKVEDQEFEVPGLHAAEISKVKGSLLGKKEVTPDALAALKVKLASKLPAGTNIDPTKITDVKLIPEVKGQGAWYMDELKNVRPDMGLNVRDYNLAKKVLGKKELLVKKPTVKTPITKTPEVVTPIVEPVVPVAPVEASVVAAPKVKRKYTKKVEKNEKGGILKFQNPASGISTMLEPITFQPEKEGKKPTYFNPLSIIPYGQLLAAKIGANKSYRAQAKAITALPTLKTLPNVYLRKDLRFSPLVDRQASDLLGKVQDVSTDIEKNNAIKLSATKMINDMKFKAEAADVSRLDQLNAQELGANQNIARTNLPIYNQMATNAALVDKQLAQLSSNKAATDAAITSNFLQSLGQTIPINQYKKGLFDVQQMYNNPNLEKVTKYAQVLLSPERKAKWEAQWKKENDAFNAVDKVPFENSKYYKAWQDEVKGAYATLENYTKPIEKAERSLSYLSMGIPQSRTDERTTSHKDGGKMTQADRVELLNMKHRHEKGWKSEENYYKLILKNNELLQKALIKIFK